jgi:nucleoside-diphosphate-sugar epimerase
MTGGRVTASVDTVHRVIVTGGSGFIGTNLVEAYLKDGVEVRNLDPLPPRNPAHSQCWRDCSILNPELLKHELLMFRPSQIHHMGARTDLKSNEMSRYEANTSGLINLINVCNQLPDLRRVIFASSRLVCKIGYQPESDLDYCPTTAYGESKVEGERLVRKLAGDSYDWVIVRPTSIWGPWFDIPYRTFFDHVRAGHYYHPAGLEILKSFGYVGNSVFQLRRLMSAPEGQVSGRTFYIGDYEAIDLYRFAQTVAREFGRGPVKVMPKALLTVLAVLGDAMQHLGYKNPPITSFRLDNLCTNMLHDFGSLPAITGPLPYNLEAGVKDTVAWMRGLT